jgi:hypothetical protein
VWWIVMGLNVAVVAAFLWAARGALRPPADLDGMLEAGAMLAVLTLISPEARPPHFLILALALTALTYRLADARLSREAWSRRLKWAFGLAVVGVLLLNTIPRTYVRKTLSNWFSDVGALGWAAGLVVVACLLARRSPRPNAPPAPPAPSVPPATATS